MEEKEISIEAGLCQREWSRKKVFFFTLANKQTAIVSRRNTFRFEAATCIPKYPIQNSVTS